MDTAVVMDTGEATAPATKERMGIVAGTGIEELTATAVAPVSVVMLAEEGLLVAAPALAVDMAASLEDMAALAVDMVADIASLRCIR